MISENQKSQLFKIISELGSKVELIKNKNLNYSLKKDNSPITEADFFVNKQLIKFIDTTDFKNIISEESSEKGYKERACWEYFWLIDPIDGTKEFINKGPDYTINIALCKKNQPIFSIVYAPARNELYHAETDKGSFKNNERINVKRTIDKQLTIVASKSHLNKETDKYIESLKIKYDVKLLQFGSSLKICKIADGTADVYPRFGPTMEWDTCAADLILRESGGYILSNNKKKLIYNKENLLNPFFIASNKKIFF